MFRLMERDQCWSDRDWCSWLESVFARLVECLSTGFLRGSLTSLVLLVWFAEEGSTSITKSQRSRAEIPSMRKPASREIISASVELCETEVRFLHIQLIGTNV